MTLYYVKGEKKKFQQCLINILKNGIESMNNNGILTIRQSPYQIDIQDEGIGMTKEQINRLGEPDPPNQGKRNRPGDDGFF